MRFKERTITMSAAILLLGLSLPTAVRGQSLEERIARLEEALAVDNGGKDDTSEESLKEKYKPKLRGILRGKYEYEPELDAERFEVRNARISLSGALPLRSSYKVEVDLQDETEIKMKDCWVGILATPNLSISVGQQRLPFSIDAHRNPSEQYFANRSFIAKQAGDVRDVGILAGYTFLTPSGEGKRPLLSLSGGLFNGSNINNQKTAWHSDWNYSVRMLFYPVEGIAIVPSIQHTAFAERQAEYTSFDIGAYWHSKSLHVEAEYLRKHYSDNVFDDCSCINSMAIYRIPFRSTTKKRDYFFDGVSLLARYDYLGDHTDGKSGFVKDSSGQPTSRLALSDFERHRMTLGAMFHVANKVFPTDIRLNYERYWYPGDAKPKESELDKIVCEVAIRF